MAQTLTLLLLLSGGPTRGEQALIDGYAAKRDVSWVAPAPTPAARYSPYRADQVLALEGRLDEARTLALSLDEVRALELLEGIERELLQHPELPQAAWLMAERHRLTASVRRAQADGTRDADELLRRARSLEGSRAPAYGEPEGEAGAADAQVSVSFPELGVREVLELDGVTARPPVVVQPGEHHVRVLRNDELLWAGWAKLGEGREARLGVRPLLACSSEDLAGVTVARTATPSVPAGVVCPRFVVARRVGQELQLAECRRQACGAFVPLVPARAEARPFPAWASLALAGVAVVGVSSLVLWNAGAFDREEPAPRTEFIYRGPGP